MGKIKVLQVIGTLRTGGAENVAMNLYRYIDREKFEFHYLVYGDEVGYHEKEVIELGGKVIHIDKPSSSYLNFTKKIERVLKINGPYDIVHAHTLFNSGFALEAAKKAGVKRRIAHSHSTKNKVHDNNLSRIYQIIMRNKILKNATDYIACSKSAGFFLYGKKKFISQGIIIKNGIKTNEFKFDEKIRRNVRKDFNLEDKFVIGHVGRLAAVKNQMFLLEIFRCLLGMRENARLLIVGEGNDRGMLEEKINEYNLTSSVILTGNRNDINELMQGMDVFVFPSLYEGLGMALIEAQATGLYCVVSNMVPKESIISDIVRQVSLEAPVEHWAEIIKLKKEVNRSLYNSEIEKEGYNVESIGPLLESFYLKT